MRSITIILIISILFSGCKKEDCNCGNVIDKNITRTYTNSTYEDGKRITATLEINYLLLLNMECGLDWRSYEVYYHDVTFYYSNDGLSEGVTISPPEVNTWWWDHVRDDDPHDEWCGTLIN